MTSVVVWTVTLGNISNVAAQGKSADERLEKVDKEVAFIEGTLKKFLKEISSAREANDVRRLNCLMTKRDLVKGFLKASERAKVVLMESSFAGDGKTADIYGNKISSYSDNVGEIEKSIEECQGVEAKGEGTSVVYIRPADDAAGDIFADDLSPWTGDDLRPGDDLPGVEGYPAVPPASPFR